MQFSMCCVPLLATLHILFEFVMESCVNMLHVSSLLAGASCVKWNRLDSHTLASAHDSDVRIWDSRVSHVHG